MLVKPGEYYLVYAAEAGAVTLEAEGSMPYRLEELDPWAMTIRQVGVEGPGPIELTARRADLVFRLTAQWPGADDPVAQSKEQRP